MENEKDINHSGYNIQPGFETIVFYLKKACLRRILKERELKLNKTLDFIDNVSINHSNFNSFKECKK